MRILICDDDALIVEQLQKYIRNFFEKIENIFFAYERVIAEPAIYAILNKKEESAYEDYIRRCCP